MRPSDALNEVSSPAHRTIIFDELFYLQLGLARRKSARRHERGIGFGTRAAGLLARMKKILPFELTGAQRRVFGEIEQDMAGEQPMQRLVQGDVGSGKTMVAWLASLQAIDNGYQALWMAPTEILGRAAFSQPERIRRRFENPLRAAHRGYSGQGKESFASSDRARRRGLRRRHPRLDPAGSARATHGLGRDRRAASLRRDAAAFAATFDQRRRARSRCNA